MALLNDINFNGLQVKDAYCKVGRFIFTGKQDCRGYIEIYSSANAESEGDPPFETLIVDFTYDYNNKELNLYEQAYQAVKELDSFQGAKDHPLE